MYKKILAIVSLVLALSLGASGAWGALNNFPDITFIQAETGAGGFNGWSDLVGAPLFTPPTAGFQTFNATFDTQSHVFTIFTNWGPGNLTTTLGLIKTADLFLNPVLNATTHTVDGALAAVQLFGDLGTTSNKVFANLTPATFQTSEQMFVPSGVTQFGGRFNTEVNSTNPAAAHVFTIPVSATGTSIGMVDVTWTANPVDPFPIPANQPGGPPLFSVSLDLDDIATQIAGFNPDSFVFLWGTATCGNDVIFTPLPPTLLLLGSGLLGLGALRLRRKIV